jgi:hypothetical protein
MHDRKTLARLNERAVQQERLRREITAALTRNRANGDVWPGDRPDFDGSVRHSDWKVPAYNFSGAACLKCGATEYHAVGSPLCKAKADATPEYAGHRVPSVTQQLDGRPITIPSDRPIVIRLVDIKIRDSHPSR